MSKSLSENRAKEGDSPILLRDLPADGVRPQIGAVPDGSRIGSRLLISVRTAREAQIAYECGADLIDIKEPSRGSLGAADDGTIAEIVNQVAGRLPISAALGELLAGNRLDESFSGALQFAKFGLAGCRSVLNWFELWSAAISRLPLGVMPVAVVYADWERASAPPPDQVLQGARAIGSAAVLVDTYDKSRGTLTSLWSVSELGCFVQTVHDAEQLCVVAGSVGFEDLETILPLGPDYVAVRGAACRGGRTAELSGERVRQLANLVHCGSSSLAADKM